MPGECAVCRRPATQTCEGCRASDYCSWEHQTADWEGHIAHCRPFKVDRNDYLGRHFVATRPVALGEVVLKERPLVAGPSRSAAAVCPGCLRRLPGEGLAACARCGWPACSEACARSERHLPECELAAQMRPQLKTEDLKSSHPLYRCLTVLRCLQQKKMDLKKWQILMRLEPHSERRMKSGMYESDRVEIVNCLNEFFDLSKDFTEEEMLKVCGIVEINGYVSHLTDPPHITIYDTASFIEHSCLANCSKTFATDGELLLRAAVAVPAGEHLSICYTDQTWGTARRRYHLAAEQLACRCARCLDPGELGTFYSGVACQHSDCSGYLLPEDPLTDANTIDEDYCYSGNTSWRCAECGVAMRASDITLFLKQAERDVKAVACPEECETLLALFDGKVLHHNHYYLTELRIKLIVTYGRDHDGGLQQLGSDLLDRKIELGRQVLALADKLFPAETRVRGLVMFELHEALAEQMRRKASEGTLKPPQLKTNMKECKKMLHGADKLLSSEPEELPEGEVAVEAKRRILDLQQCACNGDSDDQPSSLDVLQAAINPCTTAQPTTGTAMHSSHNWMSCSPAEQPTMNSRDYVRKWRQKQRDDPEKLKVYLEKERERDRKRREKANERPKHDKKKLKLKRLKNAERQRRCRQKKKRTDGCAGQFKNRYTLSGLCFLKDDCDLVGEWNFFATSHGKGAVDGVGAVVKRKVWQQVMSRRNTVITAQEFYEC